MKYDQKLCSFMDKYTKAFIVHADNVGSNQMMMIRKARRRPLLQKSGQLPSGGRWPLRPTPGASAVGRALAGGRRLSVASFAAGPAS